MFEYHIRIRDRYHRPITSLAVLGDPHPEWRPDEYRKEQLGCEVRLRFPVVKLLELDVERLLAEEPRNLFTVVVAAHRAAQGTKGNKRLRVKVELAKRLYAMGLTAEEVRERFRFLEWMIGLSEEREQSFRSEMASYEEETKMPYVLSFERIGMEKGRLNTALNLSLRMLRRKLGDVSEAQEAVVRSLPVERVESLAEALLDFTTPEDLDTWLRENAAASP